MDVFNNEVNLPKANDKLTPIRGGSVGINEVLGYFKNTVDKRRVSEWNLFLINVFTLARNVSKEKNLTQKEFINLLTAEIYILIVYIQTYLGRFPNPLFKKYLVIFYCPNYINIPDEELRKKSPSDIKLLSLYNSSISAIYNVFRSYSVTEYMQLMIITPGSKRTLPCTDLINGIRDEIINSKTALGLFYKYGDPVFLISHCPIDFYISKKIPNINLMECYTGTIKSDKMFGAKLLKGVSIPFNWYTHRAFGDSVHIAPFSKKDRPSLIELAATSRWHLKSDSQILSEILKKLNVTKNQFLSYNPFRL